VNFTNMCKHDIYHRIYPGTCCKFIKIFSEFSRDLNTGHDTLILIKYKLSYLQLVFHTLVRVERSTETSIKGEINGK